MLGFKRFVSLSAAAVMLASAPIVPAVAGGHGSYRPGGYAYPHR